MEVTGIKKFSIKVASSCLGIGGSSFGYFLSQLNPGKEIQFTTIDNGDDLGGRLRTVPVGPHSYEVGGSIIHSKNKYMVDFLDICNLKKKKTPEEAPFSLHKNGEVVFQVVIIHKKMKI